MRKASLETFLAVSLVVHLVDILRSFSRNREASWRDILKQHPKHFQRILTVLHPYRYFRAFQWEFLLNVLSSQNFGNLFSCLRICSDFFAKTGKHLAIRLQFAKKNKRKCILLNSKLSNLFVSLVWLCGRDVCTERAVSHNRITVLPFMPDTVGLSARSQSNGG